MDFTCEFSQIINLRAQFTFPCILRFTIIPIFIKLDEFLLTKQFQCKGFKFCNFVIYVFGNNYKYCFVTKSLNISAYLLAHLPLIVPQIQTESTFNSRYFKSRHLDSRQVWQILFLSNYLIIQTIDCSLRPRSVYLYLTLFEVLTLLTCERKIS